MAQLLLVTYKVKFLDACVFKDFENSFEATRFRKVLIEVSTRGVLMSLLGIGDSVSSSFEYTLKEDIVDVVLVTTVQMFCTSNLLFLSPSDLVISSSYTNCIGNWANLFV